ncbi:hypothetical protein J5N97_029086 [Dioscorea zingiberensis]|uniref:Uncharacterized protein n=1 Tax=Dioscorea zingiberensis TaxID=325984 RepID=A0A9D5H5B7_9LILI|nr:hypothetical protein J5N97_029086 [Dioscorea zingiberensis]
MDTVSIRVPYRNLNAAELEMAHLNGRSVCSYKGPRWRAAAVFVIGFWMLDLANNTVQGPARALLADLSEDHQQTQENLRMVKNQELIRLVDKASSEDPSNFDSNAKKDGIEAFSDGPGAVLVKLLTSLRHLPPEMYSVLLVMAFTWSSWFPFFLFDTDWMGREVYRGDPSGEQSEITTYQNGVQDGAFGLATGVLNLAIVAPQMIVALGAGPWDALFGGGNIPAFGLAAAFALAGSCIAYKRLPTLSGSYSSAGFHGFG